MTWLALPAAGKIGPGAVVILETDEDVGPSPWEVLFQLFTADGLFVDAGSVRNVTFLGIFQAIIGVSTDNANPTEKSIALLSPLAYPDDGDSMKLVVVIQDADLVIHTHDFGAHWTFDKTFNLQNLLRVSHSSTADVLDAVASVLDAVTIKAF